MEYIKKLFFFLTLTALVSACSNDNDKELSQNAISFFPSVSSTSTRSTMEAGFTEGDEIGLYMYNGSASVIFASNVWKSNLKLSYSNSGPWALQESLYWQDVPYSSLSCIAYYPYDTKDNQNNLSSVSFDVDAEQTTLELLRENDLLWTKVDNISYQLYSQGIPLKMSHMFSKIKVTFSNFSNEISGCKISAASCDGTLDLIEGTTTISSNIAAKSVSMYYDSTTKCAEAIVIPQTFSAGSFIKFNVGDKKFTYSLTEPLTLTKGSEYIINIDGSSN